MFFSVFIIQWLHVAGQDLFTAEDVDIAAEPLFILFSRVKLPDTIKNVSDGMGADWGSRETCFNRILQGIGIQMQIVHTTEVRVRIGRSTQLHIVVIPEPAANAGTDNSQRQQKWQENTYFCSHIIAPDTFLFYIIP